MSNQLLVNPYPYGIDNTQRFTTVSGSILLAGSAVSTGEPINWANLVTGVSYQEINFAGNGAHGNGTALVTGITSSSSVITVTAANNFVPGQTVTFAGMTTTNGKKVNGKTFTVATVTTGTSFTINDALNPGTSGADVGYCVSGNPVILDIPQRNAAITGTVTAVSASGGIVTVTADNNFLPGASVIFSGGTTGTLMTKLVAAGSLVVASSSSTAFTIVSALTGSTDTGTATAYNPPQPHEVVFYSALGSGYVYQYSETTGVLYVKDVIATGTNDSATPPIFTGTAATLQNLAAAAYPAGVLGDVIKYKASFARG